MKKQKYSKVLMFIITLLIIPSFLVQNADAEDEDLSAPTIKSVGMELKDGSFVQEGNLSSVPFNSSIIVTVQDNVELNNLTSDDYMVVKLDGTPVSGKTVVLDTATLNEKELVFTPTEKWKKGKSYTVSMSETLKDAANNTVIPKEFQFTVEPITENPNLNLRNITNPHSNFSSVEDICFTCHGIQKSMDLKNGKTIEDAATEICLTCHDGTVAKDVVGADEKYQHGKMVEGQSVMGSSQCSDCHDPHLSSSTNNPYSLKVSFAYEHKKNGVDIEIPGSDPVEVVSTQENCYSCHKEDTGRVKTLATTEIINGVANEYYQEINLTIPFNYKKSIDTSVKKEELSLCFTCHNNSGKAINIEQFYTVESGHNILYDPLDEPTKEGYLSCSDCHETHGSANMYVLKTSLGHENPTNIIVTTKFETDNLSNDRQNQKDFCISCHNGTTKLYGSTPKLFNDQILGHANNDPSLCSVCHGGDSESFVGAAHAPTRLSSP